MTPARYELWENTPGKGEYTPFILHYKPECACTDAAVLIVPGSGYVSNPERPKQEGERVAQYLAGQGINVFVLIYRVFADGCYPAPILDGRRAMRLLRHRAAEFGIAEQKIITLGYSAGGHLCASLVSYHGELEGEGIDELDSIDFVPDYQALCYPVITFDTEKSYSHKGSVHHLLGDAHAGLRDEMCFERTAKAPVPPTFLFHNFDDASVGVENSLIYACRLRELGAAVEMHVYPHGGHGVGYERDETPANQHNKAWLPLFVKWLKYYSLM